MKRIIIATVIFVNVFSITQAQNIDKIVDKELAEKHLKYLASDDMQGRDTGSPEIRRAASYIADTFKEYGVETVPGKNSYFQPVPLIMTKVPSKGELTFLDTTLEHGKDILILRGTDTIGNVNAIFAGFGTEEDLNSVDIKGKLVVARFGFPGMTNVRDGLKKTKEKRSYIAKNGGLGLIELYSSKQIAWSVLVLYYNKSSMILDESANNSRQFPFQIFVNDANGKYLKKLEEKGIKKVSLNVVGLTPIKIVDKNVVGYIEGKDKKLRDEYIILSAHYDHVGHTKAMLNEQGEPMDSIYNGARDNALGTTGLLMAAKYFGKYKPKRSILFVAFTAEEKGLLGSEYYSNHPWLPLNHCIFNINIDCAGYNDTTKTTIFGLTRNTAEKIFENASAEFGLTAIDDPIPEQNIFERSDHYNFAKHGVPSVLYGPGVTAFDKEIQKYYHQLNDEVETLDFDYLTKVYKVFIKASEDIANSEPSPFWTEGDKYENAGKELYGME